MTEWISFEEYSDRFPYDASAVKGRFLMSDTRFVMALPMNGGFVGIAIPVVGIPDPPSYGMIIDLTTLFCVLHVEKNGPDGMKLVMDEIYRYTIGLRSNGE